MRAVLERLSRGVVLRRRLPLEHGGHRIYVSPDASLRFWRRDVGRADPLLLSLCSELVPEGGSVWDIGANVGLFALAAAHRCGAAGVVVAVEADPFLVGLLRRSSRELPPTCARVEVVHAAVSDRQGTSSFAVARRSRAASHLLSVSGSSQSGGVRTTVAVTTLRLDDLLAAHGGPAVIKIDVEGAELLCLRGAGRLLSEVRPILVCEVTAENAAATASLLRGHGYTLYDAAVPWSSRRPLAGDAAWNTLALPGAAPQPVL